MNDNEKIENLENEIKSLKGIIEILSKDAKFTPGKAQTTPEKPPVEVFEDVSVKQTKMFFEDDTIDVTPYDPEDFDIEDGLLHEYLGKREEVTIPYGVTIIGNGAFKNNQRIKKVNFPDTVTEVSKQAFCNCKNLVEVNNAKNVIKIGSTAFYECSSLKRLRFSENIELIGENAFSDCSNLRISVPSTCKCVGWAFYCCKNVVIREVIK